MILQAVADANYKFTIVEVGAFGKQSDGGTLKASELYKNLNTGEMDIPEPEYFLGTNVKAPYLFIGEEAYPLLKYLKPFGGRDLSSDKKNLKIVYREPENVLSVRSA